MPTPDTIQGVDIPTFSDAPAVPTHIADVWYAMMSRANPRFANNAARDAAYPSPTDGQICYVASPAALYLRTGGAWTQLGPSGVWASYTPSLSGIAASAITARWTFTGKLIRVRAKITLSGAASGQITVGLPVTAAATLDDWLEPVGTAFAIVGGSGQRRTGVAVLASTTTVGVGTDGNTNATARWDADTPGSWVSTDRLFLSFAYEAA